MPLLLDLIKTMAVFVVVAYLYSKSPWFKPLTTDRLRPQDKIYLYLFFSAISIMGTYLGLPVQDALANTRAIGPVLAGIMGGPLLGTAVGFTGGLHRYSFGGFTAFSCGLSTMTEGFIGGLVHLYLVRKHHEDQVFRPVITLVTTMVAEMVQMLIILATARPFTDAVALVQVIAFPMIATSACGAALFMSIIRDQRNMYDRAAAAFSTRAFTIAERTLGLLAKGLDSETTPELARIIQEDTGVAAVAITDREKVLAFVGEGSDHHQIGHPISSQLTWTAIEENRVVFADGVNRIYTCSLDRACPLNSVLVVPLTVDNDVIGTIKLYESRNKRFLNMNRSLGKGIAGLLSSQLMLSRYEKQKNLLVMAELKLVQAQVNPHFLFNALNTIISILRTDPERARDLLIHVSNFFRMNLKRTNGIATLREELAQVESYVTIEKARFEDRLTVNMDFDEDLMDLRIPTFTLQPIVENAIKHGISNMLEPGVVNIHVYRADDTACIAIEDNAGKLCEKPDGDGLGMQIVDKRIKYLMGSSFGTSVECVPDVMTRVTIRLPLNGFVNDSSTHS